MLARNNGDAVVLPRRRFVGRGGSHKAVKPDDQRTREYKHANALRDRLQRELWPKTCPPFGEELSAARHDVLLRLVSLSVTLEGLRARAMYGKPVNVDQLLRLERAMERAWRDARKA